MKIFKFLLGLVLLSLFWGNTAKAAPLVYNLSKYYLNVINPISAFMYDQNIVPVMAQPIIKNNSLNIRTEMGFPLYGLVYCEDKERLLKIMTDPSAIVEESNSGFLKFLTLGNSSSLASLNKVKALGENIIPYKIINFDLNKNWYYVASSSNGVAMAFYGYSWLVNIPAKFLKQIDRIAYWSPILKGKYPASWWCLIDIIINFISLVVEIPLAFLGTIWGAIWGTLFHPLDTLCAIPAGIYLGIATTFNAVWDSIVHLIKIPYHVLFMW